MYDISSSTVMGMQASIEMVTEQIGWRAKQNITSGLRLGRSEVLRGLRHYTCGYKATQSIAWRRDRGIDKGRVRRSTLRGRDRVFVHQTSIGTVSKGNLWGTSQRRGGAHNGLSRALRYQRA